MRLDRGTIFAGCLVLLVVVLLAVMAAAVIAGPTQTDSMNGMGANNITASKVGVTSKLGATISSPDPIVGTTWRDNSISATYTFDATTCTRKISIGGYEYTSTSTYTNTGTIDITDWNPPVHSIRGNAYKLNNRFGSVGYFGLFGDRLYVIKYNTYEIYLWYELTRVS